MKTTRSFRRWSAQAAVLAGSAVFLSPVAAQEFAQEWVERCRDRQGDRAVHCEVRESRLPVTGSLAVDAQPNGGITVTGWDRNEILVQARVQARAESEEEARQLASEIRVETGSGRVRSAGPRTSGRRGWSVSYEVFVPRRTDLELRSTNGGLRVADVRGRLQLETTNGGIALERVAGDVRGETVNGGLDVRLSGQAWDGGGLDLETTNGGVTLAVPSNYSARLVASTVNGGVNTEIPMTVQGRIGKRIEADLGSGGPPIRINTTNGGIQIRRS